jgi:hypothetical protein
MSGEMFELDQKYVNQMHKKIKIDPRKFHKWARLKRLALFALLPKLYKK